MAADEKVSLETLGSGAAIEMFNDRFQDVLDNIMDPNTNPKTIREVTLKVKIKPDESRETGEVEIHCIPKFAPALPYPTRMVLGRRKGQGVAVEYNPRQLTFDDEVPQDGKVVQMPTAEKGGDA